MYSSASSVGGRFSALTLLVVCCESEKDAKNFLELLHIRLEKFGLQVSEDKTKVIKFGRQGWKQAQRSKGKV